jgi:hypothetical protein
VKLVESACPHCGAALRDEGGRLRRTATAALLGLVAASCQEPAGSDATPSAKPRASASASVAAPPASEYGPAPTLSPPASASAGASASAKASASAPGPDGVPEYGPPPTR